MCGGLLCCSARSLELHPMCGGHVFSIGTMCKLWSRFLQRERRTKHMRRLPVRFLRHSPRSDVSADLSVLWGGDLCACRPKLLCFLRSRLVFGGGWRVGMSKLQLQHASGLHGLCKLLSLICGGGGHNLKFKGQEDSAHYSSGDYSLRIC